MVRKVALALALVLFTPGTTRADVVTLSFILNIQHIGGPNPELASSVFGETPEVGSTMRALAQINPHDSQPDPAIGNYLGGPFGNIGPELILTLGFSPLAVRGLTQLGVGNDLRVNPTDPVMDFFFYELEFGSAITAQSLRFTLETNGLPPSTFSSDAIPPPQVLSKGLFFQIAANPLNYSELCEDCPAFFLGGTARAVEAPAPVPEPGTMLLVTSGLAFLANRARRRRATGRISGVAEP